MRDVGKKKAGKRGHSLRAERKGRDTETKSHSEPMVVDQADLPENPASVGFSMSVGFNTEFGREKLDCTAWITLPSGTSEKEIADTWDTCVEAAMEQCHQRLDEAVERYFPHLNED